MNQESNTEMTTTDNTIVGPNFEGQIFAIIASSIQMHKILYM